MASASQRFRGWKTDPFRSPDTMVDSRMLIAMLTLRSASRVSGVKVQPSRPLCLVTAALA